MKPRIRSIALTTAKFVIPAAIIGFLLWQIEPEDWDRLTSQRKDYGLLLAALGVALGAVAISFARWCLLVRCQGIELSMLEAFRLSSICYLLNFVSAGSVGGDLFKAIFLARRRPGKRLEAVASVFVDRGVGLYGLVLLVAIALLIPRSGASEAAGEEFERIQWATIILVSSGTAVLMLLVLGGRGVDRLMQRLGRLRLVGPVFLHVAKPLRMFHAHPISFLVAVVLSVLVHGGLTVSMYLIAKSLYGSPPTLAEHLVIVPIGMLASALPITPAGLGVLEATIEWLYRIIPSPPTLASGTLVALVFEIVKLLLAAIGTLFYWTADEEVRHSLEIAEGESQASPPDRKAGDFQLTGSGN